MNNTVKLVNTSLIMSLFAVFCAIFPCTEFFSGIFVTLIFFKAGFKYMYLSSISLPIIHLLISGDFVLLFYVIQGVIVGIITSIVISKNNNIKEDLLYGSILSIVVVLMVDMISFKGLGFSTLSVLEETLVLMNFTNSTEDFTYILVACLSLIIFAINYGYSLFVGYRLNLLSISVKKKYWGFIKYRDFNCKLKKLDSNKEEVFKCLLLHKRTYVLLPGCLIFIYISTNVIAFPRYILIFLESLKYLCIYTLIANMLSVFRLQSVKNDTLK